MVKLGGRFLTMRRDMKVEVSEKTRTTPIGTCRDGHYKSCLCLLLVVSVAHHSAMASTSIFGPEKNPRGIPQAPFIVSGHFFRGNIGAHRSTLQANVEEYIGGPDGDVEGPLKAFQDAIACAASLNVGMTFLNREKYRKYRYMDANLTQRRRSLEDKIPDIQKTLHMVEFLQERRVSRSFCQIDRLTNLGLGG